MFKLVRRSLACLLSLAMVFTMVPGYAWAKAPAVEAAGEETVTFEQYFEELSKYATVENDTSYPMAVSEDGSKVYTTNKGVSSASHGMTIRVQKPIRISFAYACSSEASYDKLLVAKNGSNLLTASGTQTGNQTIEAITGDVITIMYSKDSSANRNDDCIYLSDFCVAAQQTLTFKGLVDGALVELKKADGEAVAVNDGQAVVEAGSYTYHISAFGYADVDGSVLVEDEDLLEEISMTPLPGQKVSFHVDGIEADTVVSIQVTREGITYEAGEDGSYDLVDASYQYKIKADGYHSLKGEFTVAGEALTIDLVMVAGRVWSGDLAEAFAAGSGSETDPYLISNGEELAYLSAQVAAGNTYLDQYIALSDDIDLGEEAFTPIGKDTTNCFRGHFDGYGYRIDGLKVESTGNYVGLFGYIGQNASVSNLTVDGTLQGKQYVGGIAGYSKGAEFTNLKNLAAVTSTSTHAGGIIGYLAATSTLKGNISRCVNKGNITSGTNNFTGGIVGYTNYVTISDCYNTGAVSSNRAGGIAGQTGSSDSVSNCYNAGQVTCLTPGTYNYGAALIGYYMGTASNCYYLDNGVAAFGSKVDTQAAKAVSEEELRSMETITGLGGAYIEDENQINHGYPVLAWENPNARLIVAFQVNYQDAVIEVMDEQGTVQVPESDGTYRLKGGSYSYQVSRTECEDVTGTFRVNGAGMTIPVELVIRTYPLAVELSPEHASLVIRDADGQPMKAGQDGYMLPKGVYSYEAATYGYVPESGSLTITGEADQLIVNLAEADKKKLTLHITDVATGEVIDQANVQIMVEGSTVVEAEADGTYLLAPAACSYLVTAEGYINLKGSFTMGDQDQELNLSMEEGSNVWTGEVAQDAPASSEIDGKTYYLISSGEELAWFAQQVEAGHTDINGKLTMSLLLNSDEAPTAHSWTGIGSYSNKYTGTFDGNGRCINGYYGRSGLFGYLGEGAQVKNLTLSGSLDADSLAGALANQSYGSFSNCVNKVDITSSSSGAVVGGIVGRIYDSGRISQCSNEGNLTVNCTSNYSDVKVGGIAGDGYCEITECSNFGRISAGSKGYIYAAGILGYSNGNASYTGARIRNCYNQGEILTGAVSNTPYVAGIAARHTMGSAPVLENCYNTGSITSGSSAAKLGAIAGDYLCAISNCYYLQDSAVAAVGSVREGYSVEAIAMSETDMKKADLVLALNGEVYGTAAGSYPVFLWQGGQAVSDSEDAKLLAAAKEALMLEKTEYTEAERIDLPEALDDYEGVTISWTSSDESLISAAGQISLPEEGVAYVTLTALLSLNGAEAGKEFVITLKSVKAQQEELLAAARSYLAGVSTLTPVCGRDSSLNQYVARLLKQKSEDWKDIQVSVNETGEVTYPVNVAVDAGIGEDGSLTYLYLDPHQVPNAIRNAIISGVGLTLTLGDQQASVNKNVSLGWDEERLAPYLEAATAAAVAALDQYKTEAGSLEIPAGTETLELPYTLSEYPFITFMWASEDPAAVVIPDNTLNPVTLATVRTPEEDTEVQLGVMATFTLGDDIVFLDNESPLLTLKSESLDNLRQLMQSELDSKYLVSKLQDSVTKEILDPEHVVNDIQLLTPRNTGIDNYSDYRFTASSNDTDTAEVNGYRVNIYRPMPGEEAKEITLTITMSHRNKEISVSKEITVTVDPLTEAELQTAVNLMDQVKASYWNGLNDNFNENQYKVTHSLHAFQEAYINGEGELIWVYNVTDRKGTGITTGDLADYSSVGGQEAYNKFMSSKPAVLAHENLVLNQPQYNTEVTVSSILEHEIYGKYGKKYTSGRWYEEYFSKLVDIPVSVSMTVLGTDGEDPEGEHPVTSVSVTVRLIGADATGAMEKTITTTSDKTIAEAIQQALGQDYTLTVSGAGYIASLTGDDAFAKANKEVEYWGQFILVNGEYDTVSPLTGMVTDGAVYGIFSNERTDDPDSFWGYKYDVWFKDFTMTAETGQVIRPTVYQMAGNSANAWSGIQVYEALTADDGQLSRKLLGSTDANGQIEISFKKPGDHVLVLGDSNHIYSQCTVTVTGEDLEIPLQILAQPEDYVGNIGSEASFQIEAVGEGLSYQWYYSRDGIKWYQSSLTGHNTDTISMKFTEARKGQLYRCVVMDEQGESLTSESAALTTASAGITILSQPADSISLVGSTASFTVLAEGDELSYQWYYSSDLGGHWSKSGMTGARTPTIEIPVTKARIGQLYRCEIKDASANVVKSAKAAIVLMQDTVSILSQPADVSCKVKENAEFHVLVNGEAVSYQWYYSKDGTKWYKSGMTGSATNTLTVEAINSRNGQMYRCVITDKDGKQVTSDAAVLHVE